MKPAIATRSLVAVLAASVMLAGCFTSAYYSGTDYSCSGSSQRVSGLLTVDLDAGSEYWRVYEESGVNFTNDWVTTAQLTSSVITFSGETHGTYVRIKSDTGATKTLSKTFQNNCN